MRNSPEFDPDLDRKIGDLSAEEFEQIFEEVWYTKKDPDEGRSTLSNSPGGVIFLPGIGISAWPEVPRLPITDENVEKAVKAVVARRNKELGL